MRTVILGALALGSGCNWVFALDPVTLTDAQVFDAVPDAPLPTVKLSAITPLLDMAGATTGQAAFGPITPAPAVQYGALDGPLIDSVYTSDQEVPVGYDLAESPTPWRLVYTLAGGVPHEVHWQPTIASPGHATVLQLTPPDREAVPAGSSFVLAPTAAPGSWFAPRIYTTNAWTITPDPAVDGNNAVVANFSSMFTTSIAGPKRKPDPTKDFEVLLEYGDSGACTVVKGSAAFHYDLSTGTTAEGAQPWSTTVSSGNFAITDNGGLGTQINLIARYSIASTDVVERRIVTYGPAGRIPLHHHAERDVPLPVPVGILLAKCTGVVTTVPLFNKPTRTSSLATVRSLMYTTPPLTLAEGGVTIVDGIVISSVGDGAFAAAFTTAGFPVAPAIDGTPVEYATPSTVPIAAGGTTATLAFDLDNPSAVVHFYEATLYRVSGAVLIPVREFTFTGKQLVFTRDQGLSADTRFVFEIRAIGGASAAAALGDFSVWSDTQMLGVAHTQIFTLAH